MKIYIILSTYIHVIHTCSLLRTNMCDINLSTFIGQYYLQSIDRMRCHENGGILLRLNIIFLSIWRQCVGGGRGITFLIILSTCQGCEISTNLILRALREHLP